MLSTNANLPKLSVIMVVRNAAATIARALDSLASQHYPNLELIVWDGESTDDTLKIIGRYASLITTLKSERDNGSADGCNKALPLATGDYVGFLYADDVYEPGTLWAVAEAIAAKPGSDVISFGMIFSKIDKNGRERVTGYYADESQLALTLEKALCDLPTFVLSRFYKRGVFGPLNTDFITNDRAFIAELSLKHLKNAIIPKALYGFLIHDGGISNNPENYLRIVKEHGTIATTLLARTDISKADRRTIQQWQKRQLVFGFWKAVASRKFRQAYDFMRQGIALVGWSFMFFNKYLLLVKLTKRLGLKLSSGIDSGR